MDIELRAKALIGTPFRPQGRQLGQGLDCLGVVVAAYGLPAERCPSDYGLRGNHRARLIEGLDKHFRRIARGKARPGDLLLCRIASDQLHLAIKTELGAVHADARLRRVVERPGDLPWPVVAAFRRRKRLKRAK